jgi:hypothetical protein
MGNGPIPKLATFLSTTDNRRHPWLEWFNKLHLHFNLPKHLIYGYISVIFCNFILYKVTLLWWLSYYSYLLPIKPDTIIVWLTNWKHSVLHCIKLCHFYIDSTHPRHRSSWNLYPYIWNFSYFWSYTWLSLKVVAQFSWITSWIFNQIEIKIMHVEEKYWLILLALAPIREAM